MKRFETLSEVSQSEDDTRGRRVPEKLNDFEVDDCGSSEDDLPRPPKFPRSECARSSFENVVSASYSPSPSRHISSPVT